MIPERQGDEQDHRVCNEAGGGSGCNSPSLDISLALWVSRSVMNVARGSRE
jgi:hypothetical protein